MMNRIQREKIVRKLKPSQELGEYLTEFIELVDGYNGEADLSELREALLDCLDANEEQDREALSEAVKRAESSHYSAMEEHDDYASNRPWEEEKYTLSAMTTRIHWLVQEYS